MTVHGALRIVSGGQTGVDRAALDVAIRLGLDHGGWCPASRRAEDGVIPPRYRLDETPSRRYEQRTRWNVRDADATVLLTIAAELSGGTALTWAAADRMGKPVLHLARATVSDPAEAGRRLRAFLDEHGVRRLNIAGPRASGEPEAAAWTEQVLTAALVDQSE